MKIQDLVKNGYYGRGIAVGVKNGRIGYAYFVTGRSENSKNRLLVKKDAGLFTEPYDPALCVDPSLIIYRATARLDGKIIVTNGDHTETAAETIAAGGRFFDAMEKRVYEPDGPIFTPRIAALIDEKTQKYLLAVLKKGASDECDRAYFSYEPVDGAGRLVTTYAGEKEVRAFSGEPKLFEMPDDAESLARAIWEGLEPAYRVGTYACYYDPKTGLEENFLLNAKGEI